MVNVSDTIRNPASAEISVSYERAGTVCKWGLERKWKETQCSDPLSSLIATMSTGDAVFRSAIFLSLRNPKSPSLAFCTTASDHRSLKFVPHLHHPGRPTRGVGYSGRHTCRPGLPGVEVVRAACSTWSLPVFIVTHSCRSGRLRYCQLRAKFLKCV